MYHAGRPLRQSRRAAARRQTRAQVRKVDLVERLVLVVAGIYERNFARVRIDVLAQALRAHAFHHALHRRVDRTDRRVFRIQIRREHVVARLFHRRHHAVGTDHDQLVDIAE